MEEFGQISLLPNLGEEIEEEDRIRQKEEENQVEALLFSLGRSVSVEEIAICLNMGKEGAILAAERLRARYEERQEGLLIKKLEDRYQMVSHPKTYEGLIRVVKSPRKPVLSDVALETLSIVAYCQPITKVEIERIRGVKSPCGVWAYRGSRETGCAGETDALCHDGRIFKSFRCGFLKRITGSSGGYGEASEGGSNGGVEG